MYSQTANTAKGSATAHAHPNKIGSKIDSYYQTQSQCMHLRCLISIKEQAHTLKNFQTSACTSISAFLFREHMVEFQNGTYGGVSEWNIWPSFRMEHMAEFQNGNQNLKSVAFPWLMCLFAFTWHMATSCFDQAARLQETLKTKCERGTTIDLKCSRHASTIILFFTVYRVSSSLI